LRKLCGVHGYVLLPVFSSLHTYEGEVPITMPEQLVIHIVEQFLDAAPVVGEVVDHPVSPRLLLRRKAGHCLRKLCVRDAIAFIGSKFGFFYLVLRIDVQPDYLSPRERHFGGAMLV
jgi:hypothetical protein